MPAEQAFDERFDIQSRWNYHTSFNNRILLAGSVAVGGHPDFKLVGTNAADASQVYPTTGGASMVTTGAGNDQAFAIGDTTASRSCFSTLVFLADKSPMFDLTIKTGASVAASIIYAGFKLTATPVNATDTDSVFFRYQDSVNAGGWQLIVSIASVITTISIPAAILPVVLAATIYRLQIKVDAGRLVAAWINGVNVLAANATGPGGNPPILTTAISFLPTWGIQTTAAVVKTLELKELYLSRTH